MQQIVHDIWEEKYKYGNEKSLSESVDRVVDGVYALDSNEEAREHTRELIKKGYVLPAGRIWAGAGTDKKVTLINCFVSPIIQDSMDTIPDQPGMGIMDTLKTTAITSQMGGGDGMDFSPIRPRGAIVKRTASVSSGVLPFMDMWDYTGDTIMSAGHRRVAQMGTLRIDHPDILEFITAKQELKLTSDPGKKNKSRLENFNISVLVTDAFKHALDNDEDWDLGFNVPRADANHVDAYQHPRDGKKFFVYYRMKARDLWNKIMESTYVHAEPGIQYIDRVNYWNNLYYCETIYTSNPCGEQFLPPNGACNLGHINIAEMVINPFAGLSEINWDVLKQSCRALVRFLDNVLDVTKFPIKEQAEESSNKRRIGIGQTGYASALYQLGISYGSSDAVALMSQISYEKCIAVYEASSDLAVERGSFPLYDRDKFQAGNFVQKLPSWLREKIYKQGIRNGVLLSDAPVGTGSIVVGNVSSGIEPVFAHEYDRKVKNTDGHSFRQYKVYDYAIEKFRRMFPEKAFPNHFNTANDLTIDEHLQTAAAAQEWVDSAISKTVNCPESMSIEEFRDVYSKAYDMGLKGVTTYRPDKRSKRGSILSVGAEEVFTEHIVSIPISVPKIPREKVLDGRCYQIKWHTVPQAFYVVINDYVDEAGVRRPFEIFVTSKSVQSLEWITALTILATGIFRRGGDVSFVAEELKQVFSPTGGMFYSEKYRYVPSLVALIGIKLEEHLQWLGLILAADEEGKTIEAKELMRMSLMSEAAEVCTKCHSKALFHEEGCKKCHSCGHSDCGG